MRRSARTSQFVEGDQGLRQGLALFDKKRVSIRKDASASLTEATSVARDAINRWRADQSELMKRLETKKAELQAEGLEVQAGAISSIASRFNTVRQNLAELRKKRADHKTAVNTRAQLVTELHANREALYERRRATLRLIARQANAYSDGLRRQVIISTHSPNLTVLGDAELVIPMHVEGGKGRSYDAGAVDRPATRNRVCELLEGGVDAYRKRGERYGIRFVD
jgi:chromosome segregation ATPase